MVYGVFSREVALDMNSGWKIEEEEEEEGMEARKVRRETRELESTSDSRWLVH